MKKILYLIILITMPVCLSAFVSCGGQSSGNADGKAGLAASETVSGFPVYSGALLSAMIRLVDEAILEQERTIQALASLPEVRRGGWGEMKKTIAAFQQSRGDAGIYWFALPDGRYYNVEKGLVDQTLADRPYFADLLAGKDVAGALVVSKSTGRKSAVTAVPVYDEKNKMTGAMGATLFLDKLNETLAASLSLPEGVFFYALGMDGITVLHQRLDMVFDNPLTKDSPSLRAAAEKMLSTESGEAEYEYNSFRKRVRYAASPLTGWRFAVGMNTKKL
jgi:hypothetical protein